LKPIEEINRKAIRNSLEIEKAISAQVGPFSPARARAPSVPDKRAPPVGASLSAPSPSLYLSAPWDRAIGAILPPPPQRPLSLSVPPPPPVSSSSTSRPQSPRRGRAHDRAFSGHVRVPAPLLSLAPCLPTSPLSFAPSAQPSHPLSRSAHAYREPRHRSPTTTACSVAVIAHVPCPVPR
jgi:hypothetical protein